MSDIPAIPWSALEPAASPEEASRRLYDVLETRRSVREFSDRPVSRETIENIVRVANTAPSGANKQPWRFVCVQEPELKRQIRAAAEREERLFYTERASDRWLADLAPLGVSEEKPYLERAPWLIVVFKLTRTDDGEQVYYLNESVGIACGFLLTAVHHAGLAALTHTPSPMRFLSDILGRPEHEKPFLLIPVGYPEPGCRVPDIRRKPLDEVMVVDR